MIESHSFLFYMVLVLAIVVTRIPVIGKFFSGLDTLIHEVGHALMALIVQGEVLSIELFSDTSGVAVTRTNNKLKQFLVSIAGYPFSSAMSVLFFYMIKQGYEQALLVLFASLAVITLILWIRNWYGFFWLVIFITILTITFFYAEPLIRFAICVFFAAMMMFDSVVKSFIVLYLSIRYSKQSGDAYNLKQVTYLPAFFWGLLFVAFSLFCSYFILMMFFSDLFQGNIGGI